MKPKSAPRIIRVTLSLWTYTKCFCVSCEDNVLISPESPPRSFVSVILPVITLLAQHLSTTKFTKCVAVKANKRHTNTSYLMCFIHVQEVELCIVVLCFFPSLSFSPACPQGTFKSVQGAGLCQQCPLNSRSTIEAATLCGCRNGYYRGDMDKPEDVCTSESFSLSQTNTYAKKPKNTYTIILSVAQLSVIMSQGDRDRFVKADFWTKVTKS